MKLPNAPEPVWIKNNAKSFRQNSSNPKMNSDHLYAWIAKDKTLPSYLWSKCEWGGILKHKGIKWPKFQKIMKKADIIGWLRDSRSWDELIDNIIDWTKPSRLFWIDR